MPPRLKRLFDRQFPSVLRNNSSAAAEFEPSSVCLAKMAQNFIESQDSKPAAKCGRNRCIYFNGNINDVSDDEFDVSSCFNESSTSPSAVDSLEMLKSLIPCASVDERNLLAETLKIVEENKICKRKDDLRKIVTDGLFLLGYDASICKSRWEKSPGPSFPAGEYEYIDVIAEGERVIIDVDFRSEFKIARLTGGYKLILELLPLIFVGRSDRLEQIVSIASEAANQSLKKKGMHVPPWRKVEYMRAKWLSSHTRTNSLPRTNSFPYIINKPLHSAFKSDIGLPDRGRILSLSEKKIVRKTLKRKCRSMSVLSLVDRQQHVDRRWEDSAKNIGAKRICRQHGMYHWWPFERDWATKKGYSLGDERPIEVISLSTHAELVSRLQLIYISWLVRFSPRPSALPRGGLIVGPIALSSNEFAATNNLAQRVGQDQRGSGASGSENERTREQEDPEEICTSITKDDLLQLHGRMTHKDAAAFLQVIESTVKRKWKECKMGLWKNGGRRRVLRPPDPHGKRNTSTACETPSHNVQPGMEGELVGQNQEANVFRRDFMRGPIARNTESGSIMVLRPPDQLGERNTSTACETPSHNVHTGMEVGRPPDQHEERNTSTACKTPLHNVHARMEGEPVGQNQANEFRRDFMELSIALNTENDSIIAVYSEIEAARGSSKWVFQLEGQTMLSTTYPYRDDLVFSQSQIASTEVVNENMGSSEDRRDLLASQVVAPQKEPLLEGHVFGFGNWTVDSCSDLASSQTMCIFSQATRSSENLENWLAFMEAHLMEENVYGSSRSDPAPSQPKRTIHHTMATIPHMMPLPTERQDMRSVKLKATYGDTKIKFQFPLTSGINELKEVMPKILERELGSFKVEYKDEDGEWILMALEEHVREYLQLLTSLGNKVTELKVQDKVPNTTDFDAPESGACLMRANQSGPIMLSSEKKHTSGGLIGECLTESVLSLDDLTKRKSFPDFDATKIKAHLVRAYQSGPVVSLSENQNRGEASKRECITKSILGLEDLQQHCGGGPDAAAKSFRAIYDPGFHTPDSVAGKSFEVLETLPARKQPNDGVPLLLPGRLTQEKSPDLPRVMQFNGVEQRVTKKPRYLGGLTAQSASSSCGPIGLLDGGHIVLLDALDQSTKNIEHVATADQCSPALSLPEKKMVRKTFNRNCRTMSVIFEEKHQRFVRRCEGATKSLAMCISRKHGINQVSMVEPIHKQHGIHQWPFLRSAVGLPDGRHIQSLSEKKIVRKTLKRKCRSMSVLSLEDHKQHVDRRWEDAAKSRGARRICRQLVIHRLSTTKCIRKQHGIHWWPFQRSAVGLPDGGHILPLSEKKIMRKTLKRKCRSTSVLSLVDRQQHVDRRWEDAAKNIGAKCICRQLVIHHVSIAKRRQHGIHHRWPFQQDWATMKGYSLGDGRPVEVIRLSTHAKLVSRLQLIYISWLGRFSPRPSALAGGGEVGGPIALSLSESSATKNIAQHVGQDQSGSAASDSENERTREQEDLEEIYASITSDDLRRLYGRMNRKDAAASLGVSESTFKRKCREYGIKRWPHVRKRKVGRPPDQHGEGNTSIARKTPSQYVQTRMGGEPVCQNHEANVFRRDFTEGPTALNTENGLIIGSSSEWASQVKDQSTLSTPYPNHNALVFPQPHSMLSENRGGSIDWRNSFASQAEPFSDRHISGSSNLAFPTWSDQAAPSQHVEGQSMQSTVYPDHNAVHRFPEGHVFESINWNEHTNSLASQAEPFSDRHSCGSMWRPPDQLEGQTTQFIAHQNPNALVFPQFQIASTQVLSENEDRRNSLAFLMGHVSESSNLAFPAYSDTTSPMQFTQSTSLPNPNVIVPLEPQIASTQMLSENMGSLEIWEELLSLGEETSLGGHVSGSVNLTVTTCCDPSPSQQPMPTNRDMMPTAHVMSHLVARKDLRSVTLKVSYGDKTIKFQVPLTSRIIELKEEVKKRLKLEPSSFDFEYKDEDDGDWIFLGCDEDLTNHLQLFSNQVIRLLVVDSDASTKSICESCGSLKRKRQ